MSERVGRREIEKDGEEETEKEGERNGMTMRHILTLQKKTEGKKN